jgi:glutaconate CoA-transferase subunit A
MSKLQSIQSAISAHVPDGSSVALGLQLEQMIPFAAGHEIVRQKKRGITLIGPISDILFDQMIGAGCVEKVIAAWVGNVMMGQAYNFRRAVENDEIKVFNLTNFTIALALQAGAMGIPFLPTRTALGSDVPKNNPFFVQIESPVFSGEWTGSAASREPDTRAQQRSVAEPSNDEGKEPLLAVRALVPDVAIVHVQRADANGNAHCWGNFGVMLEAVRAAKKVILIAEEIVAPEVISSDPNRTVIPGFLVTAVVESPLGAHPSPVQGYYKRDDAAFKQYHEETKTKADFDAWAQRWISGVADRSGYAKLLGDARIKELGVKLHAYAAATDYGY